MVNVGHNTVRSLGSVALVGAVFTVITMLFLLPPLSGGQHHAAFRVCVVLCVRVYNVLSQNAQLSAALDIVTASRIVSEICTLSHRYHKIQPLRRIVPLVALHASHEAQVHNLCSTQSASGIRPAPGRDKRIHRVPQKIHPSHSWRERESESVRNVECVAPGRPVRIACYFRAACRQSACRQITRF